MLKVPYFDKSRRKSDIIIKAHIENKELLITDEIVNTFELYNGSYFITKGTIDDIFLFKKNNYETFMNELFKPEHEKNPMFRKIIRYFVTSAHYINFNNEKSRLYLGELVEALKWPQNCEVLLIYNENMIYKPICIKRREK